MANLPETPDYPAGVYQIETSDPVLGGPGGIANRQAEQLGNRTAWLKDKVDAFIAGTVAVFMATKLATARTLSINGAGSGSASFDGSANANITLTLADSGAVAGTYPKVTINAKGLVIGGAALVAADLPSLDWSKINSGKPTTLAGYGITDALAASGTAVAAAKLALARTLSISGAGSGSASFDGSANANIALTLADSGAVAGTYPKVTINAKGLVTGGAPLVAADIPGLDWSKIGSGKPTTLGGYGITDALKVGVTSLQHPVLASPTVGEGYYDTALEIREALGTASVETDNSYAPAIAFHWGGKTAVRLWMTVAGVLTWGSNAVHTAATGATQVQAENGTDTTAWMSPLRVFQAIAKKVVAATESVAGILRVASAGDMAAGTADDRIVTPSKLRIGFSASLTTNGYIALPTWLGGFVLQWGLINITLTSVNTTLSTNWTYPVAFPTGCLTAWAFQHGLGGSSGVSLLERMCGGGAPSPSAATFNFNDADAAGNYTVRVFALGH